MGAYSPEAVRIIGRRYADAVQRAVDAFPDDHGGTEGELRPIDGTPFLLGCPQPGRLSLWERNTGYVTDAYTVDGLAETIGGLMVAREETR